MRQYYFKVQFALRSLKIYIFYIPALNQLETKPTWLSLSNTLPLQLQLIDHIARPTNYPKSSDYVSSLDGVNNFRVVYQAPEVYHLATVPFLAIKGDSFLR